MPPSESRLGQAPAELLTTQPCIMDSIVKLDNCLLSVLRAERDSVHTLMVTLVPCIVGLPPARDHLVRLHKVWIPSLVRLRVLQIGRDIGMATSISMVMLPCSLGTHIFHEFMRTATSTNGQVRWLTQYQECVGPCLTERSQCYLRL